MEDEKQKRPYNKKSIGATNKSKGNNAERLYALIFRELGFDKCITSREGSKLLDDCAVDLMFIPVLAQIKAGRQKGMNYSKILMDIDERIKANFPADSVEQFMPRIVIHHKESPFIKGERRKRTEYDELVTMSFKTFTKFLTSYNNDIQSKSNSNQ